MSGIQVFLCYYIHLCFVLQLVHLHLSGWLKVEVDKFGELVESVDLENGCQPNDQQRERPSRRGAPNYDFSQECANVIYRFYEFFHVDHRAIILRYFH